MSLYAGLGLSAQKEREKEDAGASKWSSNKELLELQLRRKRAEQAAKAAVLTKRPALRPTHVGIKTTTVVVTELASVPVEPLLDAGLQPGEEEYDPFKPNEYEELVRRFREEDAREAREEHRRKAGLDPLSHSRGRHSPSRSPSPSRHLHSRSRSPSPSHHLHPHPNTRSPSPPAAPAPPARVELALSGEEAFLRRARLSQQPQPLPPPPLSLPSQPAEGFSSAASRMMGKMGWKAHGLGRDVVTSSRVILLKNMVGPGQVDGELQAETAEECRKFGPVRSCVVHEVTRTKVPDKEAVRIFVEFEREDAATRAVAEMNGRFFGGREVRAELFDEARFRARGLDP